MTPKTFATAQTTMRLPKPVLDSLKARAEQEFCSVTQLVVRICREFLDKPFKQTHVLTTKGKREMKAQRAKLLRDARNLQDANAYRLMQAQALIDAYKGVGPWDSPLLEEAVEEEVVEPVEKEKKINVVKNDKRKKRAGKGR